VFDQEWQPSIDTFTVGEPITRILTLTAAGLSEEQLPKLTMPVPDGLKVYPDQAQLHTGLNKQRLVSQKVYKFALVASAAGEYQLPEISIPWWNTVTNSYEQATIAAQTITVLANPEQTENLLLPGARQNQVAIASPQVVYVPQTNWLQWLFLVLWLLTCLAWLTSYLWQKRSTHTKTNKPVKIDDAYLALMAACKQNDGQQAIELIVPWFNKTSTEKCATIAEVTACLNNKEFSIAIELLQRSMFGKSEQTWQGQSLLTVIQQLNKRAKLTKNSPKILLNP
jgi:hypothetical protein